MNSNHNYTVIVHRKWIGDGDYTKYEYPFESYAEAMFYIRTTSAHITDFLTMSSEHSAHIELFSKHMDPDKPVLFLVLESINCSKPLGGQA